MRSLPQFMNSDSLLKLWKSKKDRMQGHQSAKEIADKVMPILSKELCKMHNRHVSARYWEIIIGPWVREFSVLYVDRKKVYDNVKTSNDCLFPAKDWNIYYDYGVFHSVQASHEFNSQIFSQLEYYNNLKTKIDNSVGHKEYKDIRIKFKTKRGKRLTARGKRWLIKMITTVSSIIYGSRLVVISSLSLKKEQLLALFIRSKGRIVPYLQSSISMEHDKVRHFSYDVQKDVFFQNRRNLCDNMLIEQRVEDLFIYLLLNLLKNSGLYQVTLSIDSGSVSTLKNLQHKPVKLNTIPGLVERCNQLGIFTHGTLVVGLPGEKLDDIMKGFDFVKKLPMTSISVFIAAAIPGSELYHQAIDDGLITKQNANKINTTRSNINLSDISSDVLEEIVMNFQREFTEKVKERAPDMWKRKYSNLIKDEKQFDEKFGGRLT